ncbi:MAG: glycosyltransferase, partial [Planctomycetes bacterium]|nr:glycosyltransferase [Planctomycetota bacterium]
MSERHDSGPPLRVGIDASAAAVPHPTGVGLSIGELVASLRSRADLSLDVLYLLSRLKRRRHFLPGSSRLFHPRLSLLLARELDVFHGPDTRLPRLAGPALVATVHDFSARRTAFASDRFRATREAHWADVAARADFVVTYTEAVRAEVHTELGVPLERIAVCPLAPTRQTISAPPAAIAAASVRHA